MNSLPPCRRDGLNEKQILKRILKVVQNRQCFIARKSSFSDITFRSAKEYSIPAIYTNKINLYDNKIIPNTNYTVQLFHEATPPVFIFHNITITCSKPPIIGGIGRIFVSDDQRLAIKYIQHNNWRLILEAYESIRDVSHPNIASDVQIFYYTRVHLYTSLYIVMPYYPHSDVRSYISKRNIIPECTVLYILHQVIRGLKYLHSRDMPLVHRDVTIGNLFISNDDLVLPDIVIGDFDILRNVGPNMTNAGTDCYKAPEVWCSNTYTEAVDVWCLGLVACELLTAGRLLCCMSGSLGKIITGPTEESFIESVRNTIRYAYSKRVIDIVLSMLQYDARKRPSVEGLQRLLPCPFFTDSWYIGEWNSDNERHGKGKYTNNKGSYDGEWKDDKQHGRGTFTDADGSYDGEWENNVRHGSGVYISNNGDSLVGTWKNNRVNGRATVTKDGESVEVTYIDGLLSRTPTAKAPRFSDEQLEAVNVNIAQVKSVYDF